VLGIGVIAILSLGLMSISSFWRWRDLQGESAATPKGRGAIINEREHSEPPVDNKALRDYKELVSLHGWGKSDCQTEFGRLITERHRSGVGEEWEYAEAIKLSTGMCSDQIGENKLVAAGVANYFGKRDSALYLRDNLNSEFPEAAPNKHLKTWSKWFANLDKVQGCTMARRYLCERSADVLKVVDAAKPLALTNVDERKFRLLSLGVEASGTRFAQSLR
jgi:hypothetical protein